MTKTFRKWQKVKFPRANTVGGVAASKSTAVVKAKQEGNNFLYIVGKNTLYRDSYQVTSLKGGLAESTFFAKHLEVYIDTPKEKENKPNKQMVNVSKKLPELPQSFYVKGKEHQIKALWQDLKEIGYITLSTDSPYSLERIILNKPAIVSNHSPFDETHNPKELKELVSVDDITGVDKKFILPQDYAEVLKFAKEQMKHPKMKEEKKIQLKNIGSRGLTIIISKDDIMAEGKTEKIVPSLLKKLYSTLSGETDLGSSNAKIVETYWKNIRIGCVSENNKFSLDEIKRVLDAYDELHKNS